jgi:hypothetical protein
MGPALLERIDRVLAELLELRAEVGALSGADNLVPPDSGNGLDADLAPDNLLDTTAAAARFNRPADTIRYWCRQEGCGVKIGGVWMASAPRIQRRLKRE